MWLSNPVLQKKKKKEKAIHKINKGFIASVKEKIQKTVRKKINITKLSRRLEEAFHKKRKSKQSKSKTSAEGKYKLKPQSDTAACPVEYNLSFGKDAPELKFLVGM